MRNFLIKILIGSILSFFAFANLAYADIITPLNPWNIVSGNITQRQASQSVKITGLSINSIICTNSSGVLTTTGCPSSGGGSGGGTFSTTTSTVLNQLVNYSNNTTDIFVIGATATTTAKFYLDPNTIRAVFGISAGYGETLPTFVAQVNSNNTSSSTLMLVASGGQGRAAGVSFCSTIQTTNSNCFTSGHVVSGFSGTSYATAYVAIGAPTAANTYNDFLYVTGGSSAKVGIGTSSPMSPLAVVGTSTLQDAFIRKEISCKYVTEGDSISDPVAQPNTWVTSYEGYNHLQGKCEWVSKGTTGDTVQNMDSTYATQIQPSKPLFSSDIRTLYLEAGTNDIANGGDATSTYVYYKSILQKAHADGFKIVAFTILPRNSFIGTIKETYRRQFNNLVRQDRALYDVLVDPGAALSNPADTNYYSDGTHLTALGGQMMAQLVEQGINYKPWVIQPGRYATTTAPIALWNHDGMNVFGSTTQDFIPNSVFSVIATSSVSTSDAFSVYGSNSTTSPAFAINNVGTARMPALADGCVSVTSGILGSTSCGGGSLTGGFTGLLAAWSSGTTLVATSTAYVDSVYATSTSATSTFMGGVSIGAGTPSSRFKLTVASGSSVANGSAGPGSGAMIAFASLCSSGTGYPLVGYGFACTGTNGSYIYNFTDSASSLDFTSGNIGFRKSASGTVGTSLFWTTVATMDNNTASFDIGTTTPYTSSTKLSSGIITQSSIQASNIFASFAGSNTGTSSALFANTGNQGTDVGIKFLSTIAPAGANSNGFLSGCIWSGFDSTAFSGSKIVMANATAADTCSVPTFVMKGGKVGIGATTTPNSTLSVKGAGITNATTAFQVTDSTDKPNFTIFNDGMASSTVLTVSDPTATSTIYGPVAIGDTTGLAATSQYTQKNTPNKTFMFNYVANGGTSIFSLTDSTRTLTMPTNGIITGGTLTMVSGVNAGSTNNAAATALVVTIPATQSVNATTWTKVSTGTIGSISKMGDLVVGGATTTSPNSRLTVIGTSTPTAGGLASTTAALYPAWGQTGDILQIASTTGPTTSVVQYSIRSTGQVVYGGQNNTISASTGAGTGPAVSVSGDSNGGVVSITTGTTPAGTNSIIATINYPTSCPTDSSATLTPADPDAAGLVDAAVVYADGSVTGFNLVSGSTALTASTNYLWNYEVHCW